MNDNRNKAWSLKLSLVYGGIYEGTKGFPTCTPKFLSSSSSPRLSFELPTNSALESDDISLLELDCLVGFERQIGRKREGFEEWWITEIE